MSLSRARAGVHGPSVVGLALLPLVLLVSIGAVLGAGPARADGGDGASLSHVERTATGFVVVLDVPAGATPTLGGVTASIDGDDYPAAATPAGQQSSVARTAVLAIDTSESMRGARFAAARTAAATFLSSAPANVAVGIVAFSGSVRDVLPPTLDRARARAVLARLTLSRGTKLYDGVRDALRLTGTRGLRTVVVLSDGADTESTSTLARVTSAVTTSKVDVDVVALDQQTVPALSAIGHVVPATDGALAGAFAAEAAILQRQVAVTVAVPADTLAGLAGRTVSVSVSLPTDGASIGAEAAVPIAGIRPAPSSLAAPVASIGSGAPAWVRFAGAGLVGVGLLTGLVVLAPAGARTPSAAQRIASYTAATRPGEGAVLEERADDALEQARQAAASILRRNRSLEERISVRLEGAGSELRSAEWLLVHVAAFLLTTLVGVLVGRGNVAVALLFMMVGGVGPWLYLGVRRTRRRRAFNAVLPDTLQLMSGSLSAGLSLAQSVDTIVREGAEPVSSAFRRVLVETRLGVSLEDAFDGVAQRFESQDFAWVVMAIRIQRQVGGNLAELLDTVASTMREREYMRRQVAALAAEGKLSAIVIGSLPPVFLIYLLLTNRTYVMPLFVEPMGWIMLSAGALLLGAGTFWMSKLIKVEV